MDKNRLTAFTDAIVAIVVTLLVLSLPDIHGYSYQAMFNHWRAYLVYIVTFLQIMAVWLNHHNLFKRVHNIDARVFWVNTAWILVLTTQPYAVKWLAQYPTHWQPATFYILDIALLSLSFTTLHYFVGRANHFHSTMRIWLYPLYGLAGVSAYYFPIVGIIVVLVVTVFAFVSPYTHES